MDSVTFERRSDGTVFEYRPLPSPQAPSLQRLVLTAEHATATTQQGDGSVVQQTRVISAFDGVVVQHQPRFVAQQLPQQQTTTTMPVQRQQQQPIMPSPVNVGADDNMTEDPMRRKERDAASSLCFALLCVFLLSLVSCIVGWVAPSLDYYQQIDALIAAVVLSGFVLLVLLAAMFGHLASMPSVGMNNNGYAPLMQHDGMSQPQQPYRAGTYGSSSTMLPQQQQPAAYQQQQQQAYQSSAYGSSATMPSQPQQQQQQAYQASAYETSTMQKPLSYEAATQPSSGAPPLQQQQQQTWQSTAPAMQQQQQQPWPATPPPQIMAQRVMRSRKRYANRLIAVGVASVLQTIVAGLAVGLWFGNSPNVLFAYLVGQLVTFVVTLVAIFVVVSLTPKRTTGTPALPQPLSTGNVYYPTTVRSTVNAYDPIAGLPAVTVHAPVLPHEITIRLRAGDTSGGDLVVTVAAPRDVEPAAFVDTVTKEFWHWKLFKETVVETASDAN